jgi:hypothetical protein
MSIHAIPVLLSPTHQAAVLDLLDLELSKHLRVVSQAEWVEGATGVQVVQAVKDVRVKLANT